LGFAIWALMNVAAFYIAFSRFGFRQPYIEASIPSSEATDAISVYSNIATPNSARSTLKAHDFR
jgi:hypothetical protein